MDLMDLRRRIMMIQGEVPFVYRRVEYLESDGGQYILTDIMPQMYLGFECKYFSKSAFDQSNYYGCIFGGRKASRNNDYQLTTYVPTVNWTGTLRYSDKQYDAGMGSRDAIHISSLRNGVYTSPSGKLTSVTYSSFNDPRHIALFALNNDGSLAQSGMGCRIYYLSFFDDGDGGKSIANFLPCVRKSDNKPGMYDTVSKTFYTNDGTGEFIVPA